MRFISPSEHSVLWSRRAECLQGLVSGFRVIKARRDCLLGVIFPGYERVVSP